MKVWVDACGAFLEHVVATKRDGERQGAFRRGMNGQEKVETPAGCIADDIRAYATVEAFPTLFCVYIAQRVPYLLSDAALEFGRGCLELDFEKVKRVHAEDGDDASTESCSCMVLREGK